MLCSPRQETLRWSPLLMQIYTRHQCRKAKVKSDGSGSQGLTPYTCLCYRCCALDAHGALKGVKQSPRPCGPLLLKIAPRKMKHALKMHVPVSLYVVSYSYAVIVPCTVLYDIPFPINVAYKTLSKYFIQVSSFVTPVHITQTATRVGQNNTLHSRS